MDNQQVKATELAYIAGFLDGEGHVSISYNKSRGYPRLHPIICFTNTNVRVLDWIVDKLEKIEISYYRQTYKRQSTDHKPRHVVEVKRTNAIYRLSVLLLPYSVIKTYQLVIIAEYAGRRIDMMNQGYRKVKLTESDFEMENLLKRLNRKGSEAESSEAIRQTSKLLDDIVHSYSESLGLRA